jgi:two-component sensor histidine kinase
MLRNASSFRRSHQSNRTIRVEHILELEETSAMALSTYRSTAEERWLLREITHRVNNEFASAIQVVCFAAAKTRGNKVKAALTHVMEKLHNYARVHRALQMPANNDCIDASAYLRELC